MKIFLFSFIFVIVLINSVIGQKRSTKIDLRENEGAAVGIISIEDRRLLVTYHDFFYANDSIRGIILEKEKNNFWRKNPGKIKIDNKVRIYNGMPHYREGKKWFYLFEVIATEDKYNFHELNIFTNTGSTVSNLQIPIDIPFEIESGKIKYIGEINLKVKSGVVKVFNEYDRDLIKLKEKYIDAIIENSFSNSSLLINEN